MIIIRLKLVEHEIFNGNGVIVSIAAKHLEYLEKTNSKGSDFFTNLLCFEMFVKEYIIKY